MEIGVALNKILSLLSSATKKEEVKEITYNDLDVKLDSYIRVKILTPGLWLDEVCVSTPTGRDGIVMKVELLFTYINRDIRVEVDDMETVMDLFLLCNYLLFVAKTRNPVMIESKIMKPFLWCEKKLQNEELSIKIRESHPDLFFDEESNKEEEMKLEQAIKDGIFELPEELKDPRLVKQKNRIMESIKQKQIEVYKELTVDVKDSNKNNIKPKKLTKEQRAAWHEQFKNNKNIYESVDGIDEITERNRV